jgi:hypothetical protein
MESGFAPVVNSDGSGVQVEDPVEDKPQGCLRTMLREEILKECELHGGLGNYLVTKFGGKKNKLKEDLPLAL